MTDQTPVPPPPPPPPAPPTAAAAAPPTVSLDGPPPPPPTVPFTGSTGGGGKGGKRLIVGGLAAAIVLGGGYGAYAVYDKLDGGGVQPHDVLPASTQAYFRLDLDPSASQKIDLFKLIRKVPDLADEVGITSDKQDLRELVFRDVLASECEDLDYDKDVKPWLGDRIGVGANIEDEKVVVAVQTTDEGKSRAGIKALFECADESYGLAYLDGYAIISPEQDDVDAAIAETKKSSLGDNKTFTKDFDQLGNQGIASGWADLKAIAKSPAVAEALGAETKSLSDAGTVATALRADGPAIELAVLGKMSEGSDAKATSLSSLPKDTIAALSLAGLGDQVSKGFDEAVKEFDKQFASGTPSSDFGLTEPDSTEPDSTVPDGTELNGIEPDGTDAVPSSVTTTPDVPIPTIPTIPPLEPEPGLGDDFGLDDGLTPDDDLGGFGDPGGSFSAQSFIDQIEQETGFKLPEDLVTLFGDSLTLAVGSENLETIPSLSGPEGFSALNIALALTSDKAAALDLVERIAKLASDAGIPLVASPTDDGAVLATNKGAADAIAEPKGSLGDEDVFKSVIPDGESDFGGFYLDIGTILDKLVEADPPDDIRKGIESASGLSAVGVSATQQDDDRSLVRLRVAFK